MLAPFLIMLREGMEAALIVGIIASYLHQTGRRAWTPVVWTGVLLAAAAALFVGAALQALRADFPQKAQELFEAAIGGLAVAVLTGMIFWMRKAAHGMASDLRGKVDAALSGSGAAWALAGMAFLAVAREGLESVFFLQAIFQQSPGPAAPLGALLGLAVSVLVGIAIFRGGLRLDLRRFFRWTGIFVIFVAAGLAAGALRNLHEAGLWNHLQTVVVDFGSVLPVSSLAGTILAGVFGYLEAPTIGEVVLYLGYLLVTLWLFLRPAHPRPAHPRESARKVSQDA